MSSTALLDATVTAGACAFGAWRVAASSHSPAVHIVYYLTAAIFLCILSCRVVAFLEALRTGDEGSDDLENVRGLIGRADALVAHVWSRVAVQWAAIPPASSIVMVFVCIVCASSVLFHYVLSDRVHHVPPSPLRLLRMLLIELYCTALILLCVPLAAMRALGRHLFGAPVLESLYSCGLLAATVRRREFARSVRLRRECMAAETYAQWLSSRCALDAHEQRRQWASARVSAHFDFALVETALATLGRVREEAASSGSPHKLAELLMMLMNRSFANINDPHNHEFPGVGPPTAIAQLLDGVQEALETLVDASWGEDVFGAGHKRAFIAQARHAHGCTALCLSGGGAIAMHHIGLIAELVENGLLPAVLSGTSGGSIIVSATTCPLHMHGCRLPSTEPPTLLDSRHSQAGLLACHTDEELPAYLRKEVIGIKPGVRLFDTPLVMGRRLLSEGVIVDQARFLDFLHALYGDLTFAEAFERTGRLVNLTTSTAQMGTSLLLNYLIAPNVLVRSAVQASCALTGVMHPSGLLAKAPDGSIEPYESAGLLFRDGSFQADVPMKELSTQFHATHFVVSQCNPHVTPLLYDPNTPRSPLDRLQCFLLDEVGGHLHSHRAAGRLPSEFANLVQEYRGGPTDVTIYPTARFGDLTVRVLTQPSEARMADFIRRGRRMTWRHLPRLRRQMQLEQCLDRCAAKLADPLASAGRRSWASVSPSRRRSTVSPSSPSPFGAAAPTTMAAAAEASALARLTSHGASPAAGYDAFARTDVVPTPAAVRSAAASAKEHAQDAAQDTTAWPGPPRLDHLWRKPPSAPEHVQEAGQECVIA